RGGGERGEAAQGGGRARGADGAHRPRHQGPAAARRAGSQAVSPRRLKLGLIGLGRLGKIYARDLATRIPEARLVAVSDTDQEALSEVSAAYEVRAAHRDPERLLAETEVEAVVIASPTHTHAALTVAAAGAGKAIFCEKPPSLSLAEAERMKAAVTRPGVF